LQEELPLLSKLFGDKIELFLSGFVSERGSPAQYSNPDTNQSNFQYSNKGEDATKFSNSQHDNLYSVNEIVEVYDGLVGL
jgi:hypothetical protein